MALMIFLFVFYCVRQTRYGQHCLEAPAERHEMTTESLSEISQELRRWAPRILAGAADEEDREGESMTLEAIVGDIFYPSLAQRRPRSTPAERK